MSKPEHTQKISLAFFKTFFLKIKSAFKLFGFLHDEKPNTCKTFTYSYDYRDIFSECLPGCPHTTTLLIYLLT